MWSLGQSCEPSSASVDQGRINEANPATFRPGRMCSSTSQTIAVSTTQPPKRATPSNRRQFVFPSRWPPPLPVPPSCRIFTFQPLLALASSLDGRSSFASQDVVPQCCTAGAKVLFFPHTCTCHLLFEAPFLWCTWPGPLAPLWTESSGALDT
jgi:hypothetical protein